jgi:adenylate kinase family enzyme
MNTLQTNYRAVIDHIAADIQTLQQNGQTADTAILRLLQERHDWLTCRMGTLNELRDVAICGFRHSLEAYMCLCERFWKDQHERTYEKKLKQLHEAKERVIHIYSLTGYDACYALMLTLKHLRSILPLPQYAEFAPALAALEAIKCDCYEQLGTYIKA